MAETVLNKNQTSGLADTSLSNITATGTTGQYLQKTADGVQWNSVDALPSQTGNSGKFLTTDGTSASWATVQAGGGAPTMTWFTNETGTTLNTGLDLESANLVKVYKNGLLIKESTTSSTSVWYATPSGQNDKYLSLGSIPLSSANTWSIIGTIERTGTTPSVSSHGGTIVGPLSAGSGYSALIAVSNETASDSWTVCLSSNGTSFNLAHSTGLNNPPVYLGYKYNFIFEFDGTKYDFFTKRVDLPTWDNQARKISSTKVAGPAELILLNAYIGSYNYSFDFGKFCMSDFKITVDNSVIFDGSTAVEGTDFTNVGCTRSTETQQDGGYMISNQSIVFANSLTSTDEICVELY